MSQIKILIADDHELVRSGLRSLLRGTRGFFVIAEAPNGKDAVRLAASHKPDVAILDISMPVLNGVEAARLIKRNNPATKILILTIHESEEYVQRLIQAGADGYVLKNADKKELRTAVRAVMDGKSFISPSVAKLIVTEFTKRARGRTSSRPGDVLTPRETEVLRLIARSKTNKEIAARLFLSVRTVNTHRTNIMQKLDIHETAGLVRYAIQIGLIEARL